jgi:hypothetical protein
MWEVVMRRIQRPRSSLAPGIRFVAVALTLLAAGTAVAVHGGIDASAEVVPTVKPPISRAKIDPASAAALKDHGQVDVLVTYRANHVRQEVISEVQRKHGGPHTKNGRKAYGVLAARA